ncbi:MAG TPA: hypothetical protein VFV78_06125 [Vicinamibacterales bacterium]|nr:hypothetical protein [Vicinamibacterales bacterium]
MRTWLIVAAIALPVPVTGCALHMHSTVTSGPTAAQLAGFWTEPVDLAQRDLFHGPGGVQDQPDPRDRFEFISEDTSGASRGFDVRDSRGREWSAKFGIEAQPEIAASRILWAAGFRQLPTCYVPNWTLVRDGVPARQPAARFRLKDRAKSAGPWAWNANPFVGTEEFGGLVVLMVIINNWDLKTSNNMVYDVQTGGRTEQWFVVKDLGASLGKTGATGAFLGRLHGTKNDVDDYEREPFIESVHGDRVMVHFNGAVYVPVLPGTIRVSHVRWICQRLDRLSDRQWHDVFRAAGYSGDVGDRYVRRLKQKVADGLRLSTAPATEILLSR